MKIHTKLKISGLFTFIILLFVCEYIEAQTPQQAVAHSHRATRRRTAVVVSSATKANDQQQAAAQSEQATEAPAPATEPAPAQTTTPPPASTQALLPIGTVLTSLPTGCASEAVAGEEYYHCGENYYKAAYQEGTIVYITVKSPK